MRLYEDSDFLTVEKEAAYSDFSDVTADELSLWASCPPDED